jgi:hypothetical protein
MKIRTKLAAVTLAAGTIIGGGAALASATSASAVTPIDPGKISGPVINDPSISIKPGVTLVPTNPTITLRPRICVLYPELCPKPSTTSTTKPTTTTKPEHPTTTVKHNDPEVNNTTVVNIDAPVAGQPNFTG